MHEKVKEFLCSQPSSAYDKILLFVLEIFVIFFIFSVLRFTEEAENGIPIVIIGMT